MATNLDLAASVNNLIGGGKPKAKATPTTAAQKVSPEELESFGNWTGQTDTKAMAADLLKRGLIGADKLMADNPNTSDPNSVMNTPSDWKPSAIMSIVANARKYNLRTPEELNANRKVLMNSLSPKIQDAMNNPVFSQNHPNFWKIVNHSIIPQQWAKYDANKNNVAKK